jgi:hypothetical protein
MGHGLNPLKKLIDETYANHKLSSLQFNRFSEERSQ